MRCHVPDTFRCIENTGGMGLGLLQRPHVGDVIVCAPPCSPQKLGGRPTRGLLNIKERDRTIYNHLSDRQLSHPAERQPVTAQP